MLGDFQVTALMLLAPMLTFLRPLLLFIGKTTFFADVEGIPIFLRLFNHRLLSEVTLLISIIAPNSKRLNLSLNYCIIRQE